MLCIFLQTINNEEDQKAFEELYKKYSKNLLTYAIGKLGRSGNFQDAEDAVSQTFCRIIMALPPPKGDEVDSKEYKISIESAGKENAMHINMYDATISKKFSVEDTAQNIIINNDIVLSYFANANIYIWKDENFIYKINVFDSEISSETVIDMIRNLYKNN